MYTAQGEGRDPWRGMAGGGEVDGRKTVEGLRGRLLAERAASRAAKEEADLMTRRLSELERMLAMEIRARDRAEKLLKCILEKLDPSKVFYLSGQSVPSSGASSGSSSPTCSRRISPIVSFPPLDAEKKKAEGPPDLSLWEDLLDGSSDATSPCSTCQSNYPEERSSSPGTSRSSGEENTELEACPKSTTTFDGEAADESGRGRTAGGGQSRCSPSQRRGSPSCVISGENYRRVGGELRADRRLCEVGGGVLEGKNDHCPHLRRSPWSIKPLHVGYIIFEDPIF